MTVADDDISKLVDSEENYENPFRQSSVLPYRLGKKGLEVLMITSMKRKRWIIPKGIVEPDMTPWDSAAKEALEEAGVEGDVSSQKIGRYHYEKWGGLCRCDVFPCASPKCITRGSSPRSGIAPGSAATKQSHGYAIKNSKPSSATSSNRDATARNTRGRALSEIIPGFIYCPTAPSSDRRSESFSNSFRKRAAP